jgi:hypothetical protein
MAQWTAGGTSGADLFCSMQKNLSRSLSLTLSPSGKSLTKEKD